MKRTEFAENRHLIYAARDFENRFFRLTSRQSLRLPVENLLIESRGLIEQSLFRFKMPAARPLKR